MYVFHQGYGENGQLWFSPYDGTNCEQDGQVIGTDANGNTLAEMAQPVGDTILARCSAAHTDARPIGASSGGSSS